MKTNNKRGFTIVELVIVVAVIAILAAVLIPTFGSVVADAKQSAAIQVARTQYTQVTTDDIKDDGLYNKSITVPTGVEYTVSADNKITAFSYTHDGYKATLDVATGKWSAQAN